MRTTTLKKRFDKVSGKHVGTVSNIKNIKIRFVENIWKP